MKRLIITKLIVISQSESRSLEVPFSKGLNIIYGGNKTGRTLFLLIFCAFNTEKMIIALSVKRRIFRFSSRIKANIHA